MHDLRHYEVKLRMRRPEIAIYSDIIDAILKHGSKSNTKIQNAANLEYERMMRLIKKMQSYGFLDEKHHVTEKGKSFRKDFEVVRKNVAQIFEKHFDKSKSHTKSHSMNHR